MKLRFGIDAGALARIRAALDAVSKQPPIGRRLSYVYLDTPDDDLARRGVALRFRRSVAIGVVSPGRAWQRQEIWPKAVEGSGKTLKKLGIPRLKQRLDATFDVRIERWSWILPDDWATVSLDRTEVSTGSRRDAFSELRIVCKRKHAEAAMNYAVELGAMHLSSTRARERGQALLRNEALLPG